MGLGSAMGFPMILSQDDDTFLYGRKLRAKSQYSCIMSAVTGCIDGKTW